MPMSVICPPPACRYKDELGRNGGSIQAIARLQPMRIMQVIGLACIGVVANRLHESASPQLGDTAAYCP